jgi:hypothetical protein
MFFSLKLATVYVTLAMEWNRKKISVALAPSPGAKYWPGYLLVVRLCRKD